MQVLDSGPVPRTAVRVESWSRSGSGSSSVSNIFFDWNLLGNLANLTGLLSCA